MSEAEAVSKASAIVVIPTYNESQNISRLIPALLELPVNILVVDDASSDGTADIVREFGKSTGRVDLLGRPGKLGLGSAYKDGFALAQSKGYETIIQMDADGSHRVEDLRKMLEYFQSHGDVGLLIGSRWVQGGAVKNWPKYREILSRSANIYSRAMLGLSVKDMTAGFRIYQASLLREMKLQEIESEGYAFQIEMTRAAEKAGGKIVELPILFVEREFGVSKMSNKIIREALIKVTKWGVARKFSTGR